MDFGSRFFCKQLFFLRLSKTYVFLFKIFTMRYFLVLFLIAQFQIVSAQTNNFKFRVYLTDKPTMDLVSGGPLSFLSQKALDRREEQNVRIDSTDYPVSKTYKKEIANLGAQIVTESRWFNTVVVEYPDSTEIAQVEKLDFVDSVQFVWRGQSQPHSNLNEMRPRLSSPDCSSDTLRESLFGASAHQFALHNAQNMLTAGFQGKGIYIAVIDAGFTNIDVIPSFIHSFLSGYKDFVPNGHIFSASDHGTRVVSTMALNLPHKAMGSAPQASYLLLRSEDEESEFPVEEDYWVAAVEYADSLGVRLVNTSLGYNHFDDSTLNYTHKELNGKRSLISRAADSAFNKGMLVVGSAGNEGNKAWEKITVPGDSKKMLTIGAVGTDSIVASFSSRGPTADGRIKPDLVSVGRATLTIGQSGIIGYTNGTSFSSPFLAGLIGSLWSVNPQLNRNELIEIVRSSSHQFHSPDSIFGYGIPDFKIAYDRVLKTLKQETEKASAELMNVSITDDEKLMVELNEPEYQSHSYSVRILDEKGDLLINKDFESTDFNYNLSEERQKGNNELYIVVQSPFKQNSLRLKI